MAFQSFVNLAIESTGVTGKTLLSLLNPERPPLKSVFFQGYQSTFDPIIRAATILTAPISLIFIAAGCAVTSVVLAFVSLGRCVLANSHNAKQPILASGYFLLAAAVALMAAIASPVIHAIDLIGGGITSLAQQPSKETPKISASL